MAGALSIGLVAVRLGVAGRPPAGPAGGDEERYA
jgi:hypothetical protein